MDKMLSWNLIFLWLEFLEHRHFHILLRSSNFLLKANQTHYPKSLRRRNIKVPIMIQPSLLLSLALLFCGQQERHAVRATTPPAGRLALVRMIGHTATEAAALLSSFELWGSDYTPPCRSNAADGEGTLEYEVDLIISISRESPSTTAMVEAIQKEFESQAGWGGCFSSVSVFNAGLTKEEDIYNESAQTTDSMWVNGPNQQFHSTFHHLQGSTASSSGSYNAMFLMESDTFPLVEGWLTLLVEEIHDRAPFGILGSKYQGHAWDTFADEVPVALAEHINGNAVYNLTSPLLTIILDELEEEMQTLYRAIPYDYRISQIITEGSKSIASHFPFPELLENEVDKETLGLPDKMNLFQELWKGYGDEAFAQQSNIISNHGTIDLKVEDIGDTAIVHGKQFNPLLSFEEQQEFGIKTQRSRELFFFSKGTEKCCGYCRGTGAIKIWLCGSFWCRSVRNDYANLCGCGDYDPRCSRRLQVEEFNAAVVTPALRRPENSE